MTPAIKANDEIITKSIDPKYIEVEDVVTYYSENLPYP